MKYAINDTIIEYKEFGQGKPILFVHGWGMDYRIMYGCFDNIMDSQYKRIYIDLPGMGDSIAGESIKNSDDVLEVLHSFVNDVVKEEFILVGESYGGYLARGFINLYPDMVKALILLCPLMYPGYRKGNVEKLKVMERDEEFLKTLSKEEYDSFTYMNVILTKEVWELFKRDIMPALEKQNKHFLNEVLDGACSFDVDDLKNNYTKPSLIIVGKQDTEVGYKDQFLLLEKYPNSTYCAINGASHNLQIEKYKLFQSIVSKWLGDLK